MPRTVVAQISDPHITGPRDELFEGSDPVGNLSKAIAHAAARAEVVVITGDLAARAGTDAEYEGVRAVLDSCGTEVLLCAGNHDESRKIRTLFGVEGREGRLDYVRELSGGRLAVLDSSREGRGDGALDDSQLAWLEGVLSDGAPTLVAMHHPCFAIGGRGLAGVRLDDESVDGLASVVSRHANVLSVVSGHAHMTLSTAFAGTVAHACPSVAYEFDFRGRDLIYRPGLPRYMLYTWSTGGTGFFAREMTVAPGDSWLVMESF
ncbi:MAG: metallophosphoesterase [Actinomycetota bacterium]